jgi:hypothetical protein
MPVKGGAIPFKLHQFGFDAIDVQPIDLSNKGQLARVTSYSSKFIGYNDAELAIGEDFRIYPHA